MPSSFASTHPFQLISIGAAALLPLEHIKYFQVRNFKPYTMGKLFYCAISGRTWKKQQSVSFVGREGWRVILCHPCFGVDGRNGMVNTLEWDGRGGGHAKKFGWYPSLLMVNFNEDIIYMTFKLKTSPLKGSCLFPPQ